MDSNYSLGIGENYSWRGDAAWQYESVPVNVAGLISIAVFYILMLAAGFYATWRGKALSSTSEDVMLAGRNVGLCVGIFTMTGTWVGGGYINGTAESVALPGAGLVWTLAPVCYSLSIVLNGILFARKMHDAGYVTMLDPLEQCYGKVMVAFLYTISLLGDLLYSAAILSALGATLSVVLGLNHAWSVIVSAAVAIIYTMFGGLYSVAFTDVIQVLCIFFGLWICVPFVLLNPVVRPISETAIQGNGTGWLGSPPSGYDISMWLDSAIMLLFGGIPWQEYYQRVLACKTARLAQIFSFVAGVGCIILAIPSVLLGAAAKSTDWNSTEYRRYGPIPIPLPDYKFTLPYVLQYLCPQAVSVVGLGAVSAAVMSSADSAVLSSSAMFARNVYSPLRQTLLKIQLKDCEVLWVMKVAVLVIGALASYIAIAATSVYGLFVLCSDVIYVIIFPQLLLAVYTPSKVNPVGSAVGFLFGLVLRLLGGEPEIGLPALIRYPWYISASLDGSRSSYQRFPHKLLTMLITLFVIPSVSCVANVLSKRIRGKALNREVWRGKRADRNTDNGISSREDVKTRGVYTELKKTAIN